MLSFRYQGDSFNVDHGSGDDSIAFPGTRPFSALPGFREHGTYQISDAFSHFTGAHSMKFGVELRRTDGGSSARMSRRTDPSEGTDASDRTGIQTT